MGQGILILLLLLAAFYVFRYVVPGRRESALDRSNAAWANGNGNPYKAVSIHWHCQSGPVTRIRG